MITLFVLSQLVTAIIFIIQALLLATGHHLGHGTDDNAVTRTVSACLAVAELPFNLLVFVLLSFCLKRLRPASPA